MEVLSVKARPFKSPSPPFPKCQIPGLKTGRIIASNPAQENLSTKIRTVLLNRPPSALSDTHVNGGEHMGRESCSSPTPKKEIFWTGALLPSHPLSSSFLIPPCSLPPTTPLTSQAPPCMKRSLFNLVATKIDSAIRYKIRIKQIKGRKLTLKIFLMECLVVSPPNGVQSGTNDGQLLPATGAFHLPIIH